MECHCNDHLPGDWQDHRQECDCHKSPNTTYSFVVTKVIDDFPGTGAVFISKTFMENLRLSDYDAVEILGPNGCIVQAKDHPTCGLIREWCLLTGTLWTGPVSRCLAR